jgi:arylsulfatase A-like enzyme
MMHAVDEGVENITKALRETLRWDTTLLIFTTDNGGTGSSAGTNWPLRGQVSIASWIP